MLKKLLKFFQRPKNPIIISIRRGTVTEIATTVNVRKSCEFFINDFDFDDPAHFQVTDIKDLSYEKIT
jgi:hypothetical protein